MGKFAVSIEHLEAKSVLASGGQSPPEAETLFAFECSIETANLPIFLKFGNAKDHQTLLNFAILALKNGKNASFHITLHFTHLPRSPNGRICTEVCTGGRLADGITCFKFCVDRLRGFGSAQGQILPFSIDLAGLH